jgi:hypothetical protein
MSNSLIPPRKFSNAEVSLAIKYLTSHSESDWIALSKLEPMEQGEARGLSARVVHALSMGGFVDNLSHGASLLFSIISKLHAERSVSAPKKADGV